METTNEVSALSEPEINNGTTIEDGVIKTHRLEANTLMTSNLSVTGTVVVGGRVIVNGVDVAEVSEDTTVSVEDHIHNIGTPESPHLDPLTHKKLLQIAKLYEEAETEIPVYPIAEDGATPASSIPLSYFPDLFSSGNSRILPGASGKIYGTRVPHAYPDVDSNGATTYANTGSSLTEAAGFIPEYFQTKLWDNAGLRHECSTDTVEGVDDYYGSERLFYWEYGNYVIGTNGSKYITAVRGMPAGKTIQTEAGTYTFATFDQTKNIAAFGPIFWFAVKEEKIRQTDGTWLTHDGTEEGHPLTQLWIISDSPWDTIVSAGITYEGISESQKAEMEAHGITKEDWHVWPSCRVFDEATGKMVLRPYWCHAAFVAGYEEDTAEFNSKLNAPVLGGLSYHEVNEKVGYSAAKATGAANIVGFGILFDIVKNATKDSQAIHCGNERDTGDAQPASATSPSDKAGYLFPIDPAVGTNPAYAIGRTVCLSGFTSEGDEIKTHWSMIVPAGTPRRLCQYGRIKAKGYYSLTTGLPVAEGTAGAVYCFEISPSAGSAYPVQPFVVVDSYDKQTSLGENAYCCGHASLTFSNAGETYEGGAGGTGVIGHHDGSVNSLTEGRNSYRVQGTEYSVGCLFCPGDALVLKGDGKTAVQLASETGLGETIIASANDTFILTCPDNAQRVNPVELEIKLEIDLDTRAGSDAMFKACVESGYNVNGPVPMSDKNGTVYNVAMNADGIAYPTLTGNDDVGHKDRYELTVGSTVVPRGLALEGSMRTGWETGSAFMRVQNAITTIQDTYGTRA